MRGVKVVEGHAFGGCESLEYVKCNKLEIVGAYVVFSCCESLSHILDLPSAGIVEEAAFSVCALEKATFGPPLESINRIGGIL